MVHCWACGKSMPTMWRCDHCDTALYCSENCQTLHWQQRHHHMQNNNMPASIGVKPSDAHFHVSFFNGNEQVIGRGGRGVAFMNPNFPGIVIKKANDIDTCRGNNEEYDTITNITSSLGDRTFGMISMVRTYSYSVDDFLQCFLVMDHVQRPITDRILKTTGSIQLYLGEETYHMDRPGRGEYVGRREFLNLFGDRHNIKSLLPLCKDMGRFISSVHFIAQYDGVDLEYVVGYLNNDTSRLCVVVIDFDLCKKVKDWSYTYDGGIEQCAWSLTNEPYFPHYDPLNADEPHYLAFKQGYLEVAREAGKEPLAQEVIKEFESEFKT